MIWFEIGLVWFLEDEPSFAEPSAAHPSARPPPQTEACVNFLELRLAGELPACCLNTNPEAPVPNVRMDRAEWEAFNEEFNYPQSYGSLPCPAPPHSTARPPAPQSPARACTRTARRVRRPARADRTCAIGKKCERADSAACAEENCPFPDYVSFFAGGITAPDDEPPEPVPRLPARLLARLWGRADGAG